MQYDSNQISREIAGLMHNKELAFQSYHKICGAIDMLETMQKNVLASEKEEQEKIAAEEKGEMEPVSETAIMD